MLCTVILFGIHVHVSLFVNYSNSDFMHVYLFEQDVTKGARNKILLSIKKLHKRQEILAEIDQVSVTKCICVFVCSYDSCG